MNLQEALANLTGVTARLEALSTARDEATASLAVATARITELEGLLSAAPDATAFAAMQASLTAAEARVTELTASQADFDGRVVVAANAAAASIIASNGHAQVQTVVPAVQEDPTKPKAVAPGLTGFAKVAAFFKSKEAK